MARIGRVATTPAARSGGVAAALVDARALDGATGPREVVLDAQVQLQDWYARFGFAVTARTSTRTASRIGRCAGRIGPSAIAARSTKRDQQVDEPFEL